MSTRMRQPAFRVDQLETLSVALGWLLEYHNTRIGDGSSNRPSDKLDRLALLVSRDRLMEIAVLVQRAKDGTP